MKQRSLPKQILRALGSVVLAVFIAGVALYYIGGSMKSAVFIAPFHEALADAKTVELVEFDQPFPLFAGELVFKRAIATPAQIAELKKATAPFFAPVPVVHLYCWTPHHRILATRNDGRIFELEVCFQCSNISTEDKPEPGKVGNIESMPSRWDERLRKLFTDAGMAPIDDYSERAKAHPGYQELEKAARKADEDFWPNPGGLPVSNP